MGFPQHPSASSLCRVRAQLCCHRVLPPASGWANPLSPSKEKSTSGLITPLVGVVILMRTGLEPLMKGWLANCCDCEDTGWPTSPQHTVSGQDLTHAATPHPRPAPLGQEAGLSYLAGGLGKSHHSPSSAASVARWGQ